MASARSSDESLGSVFAALAANTAIATAKGTAAALTGSPALLAETLHTVADAGNEVLLYIAIRRSRQPADSTHPFGYGPERYYWALLAAIGMFLVGGAVSIWDGIRALVHPPELEAFWVGVGVLVVAIVLDGLSRVVALRQLRVQAGRGGLTLRELLRESPDPTVVTIYFEDTIDVLGAVLALLALVVHRLSGSGTADALASIAIGALLCFIASRLTRRNRQLLTNQSVPGRYVVVTNPTPEQPFNHGMMVGTQTSPKDGDPDVPTAASRSRVRAHRQDCKALGLDVPDKLLALADEVIE